MTSCKQVETELASLLEAEVLPETIGDHLDSCESCAALLLRSQRTAGALAALGNGFVLAPELVARVLARAPADPPHGGRARMTAQLLGLRPSVALRVAATAAAVGLVVWVAVAPRHRGEAPPSTAALTVLEVSPGTRAEQLVGGSWRPLLKGAATPQRIRTDRRGRIRLRLADGTQLGLNRESELALDAGDSVELRRGELLAEVTPRRSGARPFAIRVPTGRVEVLGTKLHVAADAQLALVDVVHGAVRVGNETAGWQLVGPGQEGALSRAAVRTGAAPDLGRVLAWAEPPAEAIDADPAPPGLGSLTARLPGRKGRPLPLELREHLVTARIQGALARTEVSETFENPTDQTLEGIYKFPLPAGARISRLALWVDGRLEEGAIVERDRAARIWRGVIRQATPVALRQPKEEFVWVPGPWRDPALLEWQQGNQFELRIFPIPPRGKRTVVLAYTETLPRTARGRRYVYPLAQSPDGKACAGLFRFEATLAGHAAGEPLRTPLYPFSRTSRAGAEQLTLAARDFVPAGDLVVDFGTLESGPVSVHTFKPADATDEGYVLFTLRPELPGYRDSRARSLLLVVDRSYSSLGEASRRQKLLVAELLGEADPRDEVAVLACDSRCRAAGSWASPSPQRTAALLAFVDRSHAGGATDLGETLRAAGELLDRRAATRPARVIYLGDGTPTAGELEPGRLAGLVRRHLGPRDARLTTVGVGTSVDAKTLEALARAGGGSFLAYAPGTSARGQALQVLARQYGPVLEELAVELPEGVERIAPRRLSTLHAGEELLVAGRVAGRVEGKIRVSGRVHGEPFRAAYPVSAELRARAGNAFLPRLWAELMIDDKSSDEAADHRAEIVELSKRHQVLSRHTSLLVLESEAMRRAFKVAAPTALQDWTGREAAEDAARSAGVLGVRGKGGGGSSDAEDALGGLIGDDAAGAGGLGMAGTIGKGAGAGTGEGYGRGVGKLRGHRASSPQVQGSSPTVQGSLDREMIRRVIRRHLPAVRAALERRLKSNPNDVGRAVARFTIGPTGQVAECRVDGVSAELQRDLRAVLLRMQFPAPAGGGIVTVSYPFVFRAAGEDGDGATANPLSGLPSPGAGRWVRMKRVWFEEAGLQVLTATGASATERWLVERRRRELEESPDSRDRHQRLYLALSRAGDAEDARALVETWLTREPQSLDALALLAESSARLGDREDALRTLGSLVELEPRSALLHRRLAEALAVAGDPRGACAHRLSLAALAPADPRAAAAAERCRSTDVGLVAPEHAWGAVRLQARWGAGADLDLALVDGHGRRLSWVSPRRAVSAAAVAALDREELALSWLPAGRYRIEVSRGRAPARHEGSAIRGSLTVSAPGLARQVPFRLEGDRVYVAELKLERRSRLEPAE